MWQNPVPAKRQWFLPYFEAKDTRNNLRTIASKYKEQLEDLLKTVWRQGFQANHKRMQNNLNLSITLLYQTPLTIY